MAKGIIVFLLCLLSVWVCSVSYTPVRQPEVVSSMKFNSDEYLAVVAYADKSENKEEFAEKVISMCRDNSFKKIKFTGKPTSLRISVYCWEEDIGKKEKELEIKYLPKEPTKKYDIVDNPEEFEFYIDGVLVEK